MPNSKLSSLSVFVPTYNEEANIALLIKDALDYLPQVAKVYELIIVNDGSTDQTLQVVQEFINQYSEVKVISHKKNRGYGAAVKTGLRAAKYDWVFFTDSDRQFHFDELPHFVSHHAQADFVIGYRKKRRDPFFRLVLAQGLLRLWNYVLFGLTVKDIDCAYKLIPTKAIHSLSLKTDSAITVTEIILRLIKSGYTYVQIPITHYPRPYGEQTGSNPRVIIKALTESLTLWRLLK